MTRRHILVQPKLIQTCLEQIDTINVNYWIW